MTTREMLEAIETYENGNRSDTKAFLSELDKSELIQFIRVWNETSGVELSEILDTVSRLLD